MKLHEYLRLQDLQKELNSFYKECPFGAMNTNMEMKIAEVSNFVLARLASFGQSGFISDSHVNFQNPGIGSMITNDHKYKLNYSETLYH